MLKSQSLGNIVGRFELEELNSIGQLLDQASAWDRLWERSPVTLPTVRAELIAEWVAHFAAGARFRGLVVWQGGEMVAGLPMVGRRVSGVLDLGDLTWNHWSPNGELLIDAEVDTAEVTDLMAGAMGRLPWPLAWLEMVPHETAGWRGLIGGLLKRGLSVEVHPRYRIGLVDTDGDFAEYQAARSKNLRRGLGKHLRRLESDGPVRWEVLDRLAPEEVEVALRKAFEIERRSWKRAAGGSVLDTPGVFDFYHRQALKLAEWGNLRLAFMEHRGRPIAFELGWTAKGVYHSFKVSYDEAYAKHGPGQLLRRHLIESSFNRADERLVDFQGPLSDALDAWATRSYGIARVVVAPRRFSSRALFGGYRLTASVVRRFRRTGS